MRVWFAASGAAMLAIVGVVLWRSDRASAVPLPPARAFAEVTAATPALPAAEPTHYRRTRAVAPDAPEPDPKSVEEKRFARYDKDRDGGISREEYMANRKKSFAKLDTNGDGKLSFEEYAAKAEQKFDTADADHRGKLTPDEFATTAIKHRPKAKCAAPEAVQSEA